MLNQEDALKLIAKALQNNSADKRAAVAILGAIDRMAAAKADEIAQQVLSSQAESGSFRATITALSNIVSMRSRFIGDLKEHQVFNDKEADQLAKVL